MTGPVKSPVGKLLVLVGGVVLLKHVIGRKIEASFEQTHETAIDVVVGQYRVNVLKPLPGKSYSCSWIVDPVDRHKMDKDPGPAAYGNAPTVEQAYAAAVAWVEAHG